MTPLLFLLHFSFLSSYLIPFSPLRFIFHPFFSARLSCSYSLSSYLAKLFFSSPPLFSFFILSFGTPFPRLLLVRRRPRRLLPVPVPRRACVASPLSASEAPATSSAPSGAPRPPAPQRPLLAASGGHRASCCCSRRRSPAPFGLIESDCGRSNCCCCLPPHWLAVPRPIQRRSLLGCQGCGQSLTVCFS